MSDAENDEFFDTEEISDVDKCLIYKFRSQLPEPMPSKANFSVWQFLKQCIGKELSKITMPIVFNEPISFVQRLAEYMEYSELLYEATEEKDPVNRLEKICAFATSVMASNWDRIGKPFNPLLGETYELHTNNFKWISEQVSHHPPVSAFYCESEDKFKFYGNVHPKLKFWGKSVEITPRGNITLELPQYNEAYTWSNVTCTVHNVIVGKIWIEHSGTMKIIKHHTSPNHVSNSSNTLLQAELQFHSVGWFGRNMHRVTGEITYNKQLSPIRDPIRKLYGKWTEALFSVEPRFWNNYDLKELSDSHKANTNSSSSSTRSQSFKYKAHNIDNDDKVETDSIDDPLPANAAPCDLSLSNQRLIWCARPRPEYSSKFYNFTSFTMGLNQLMPAMTTYLAPTDSRFRRDMRLMEQGLIDEASEAKIILEVKQRNKRQKNSSPVKYPSIGSSSSSSNKNSPTSSNQSSPSKSRSSQKFNSPMKASGPIWFVERDNPFIRKSEWIFTGNYWFRDWSICPDIF